MTTVPNKWLGNLSRCFLYLPQKYNITFKVLLCWNKHLLPVNFVDCMKKNVQCFEGGWSGARNPRIHETLSCIQWVSQYMNRGYTKPWLMKLRCGKGDCTMLFFHGLNALTFADSRSCFFSRTIQFSVKYDAPL